MKSSPPEASPTDSGSAPDSGWASEASAAQHSKEGPSHEAADSNKDEDVQETSAKDEARHQAGSSSSAWTTTVEGQFPCEGMPSTGSVVRVGGLRSLPELNGTLAEVLRPAASERVVVQTCVGEKALRLSNVDGRLSAVAPPWAAPLTAGLLLCSLVAPLAGQPLGAALVPVLAFGWAVGTLALCLSIYRCCWHSWCLPSFSSVCSRMPNRIVLRLGFAAAGALLVCSNWLYGEFVLPQILDGPLEPAEELPVTDRPDDLELECSGEEMCNLTENATGNATNTPPVVKPTRIPSPALIHGSLFYGYMAAFTFPLLGLFFCDGSWWTALVHVLLGIVFIFAGAQHTWTSSSLLTSMRGRRYAEHMGELCAVAKFRQMISDFAPLVAMGVPITAQILCQSRITQRRNTLSAAHFLESSGILLSMKALQWGLMLTYLIFVGTYALDFWILSQLPPDEELI